KKLVNNAGIKHCPFTSHLLRGDAVDWLNKSSWAAEDMHFAPKRKVNNRGSQRKPHVIGAFHSPKMNTVVEYESLGEYLFQVILELDSQVVRYYVQPVEIPILFVTPKGDVAIGSTFPMCSSSGKVRFLICIRSKKRLKTPPKDLNGSMRAVFNSPESGDGIIA
ncbi:hypothetical protein, partial [Alicyclobacillus shizuokensis]|uniref:hypothetical protein n=1 Tax=Alicyclobacillus shizuokensis TaxID=392014 RepID=UPI001FE0957E